MKSIVKLTSILLLAWIFQGCEKTATNVDLPVVEAKLVVYSFISPQETEITVKVSKSKPVFGTGSFTDWVSDAIVKLTDGATTVQLSWDFMNNEYKTDASNLPIVPGKTYTLMVSTPDGKTASGSTTVPGAPNGSSFVTTFDTATKVESSSMGGTSIVRLATASVEWKDNAGEKNFYRAGAVLLTQRGTDTNVRSYYTLYNTNGGTDLFTDKDRDGQQMSNKSLEYRAYYFSNPPLPQDEVFVGFNFYLLNVDEHYHRYHTSANNNNPDDPFSEPTLVYSNITGGLGCFAAYNEVIKKERF